MKGTDGTITVNKTFTHDLIRLVEMIKKIENNASIHWWLVDTVANVPGPMSPMFRCALLLLLQP